MKFNVIVFLMVLYALAASGWAIHIAATNPVVCKKTSTVVEILELRHRDAVIRLADGTVKTVNQATLKPGDSTCVYYGREND